MQSSLNPIKQVLTDADKAYLSRLFVTREDFSANQAITNKSGLFLVFGDSIQSNLDTTLSILEFLEDQKVTETSSNTLVHWTKNSHRYIDDSAFDNSEYHFTDFEKIYKASKSSLVTEHVFIYTDALSSGKDLSYILSILQQRKNTTVFMNVISENYEDAMIKVSNLYGSAGMRQYNIGSLSSKENALESIF